MSRPAWSRSATIYDEGGHPQKTNYMGQGVIDARTDVGAEHINRMASDIVAMTRVAPLLVARMTLHDSSPADPTVHWCVFQPMGQITTDFDGGNPPTGYPTFERFGGALVRVTFAASYTDEYGTEETTVLRDATGNGSGSSFATVMGTIASDTTAEFFVTGTDGIFTNDATITVRIF